MKAFLQKLFAIPLIGGLLRKLFAGFVAKEAQDLGVGPDVEKDLRSQIVTPKEPTVYQSHLPVGKAHSLMQGQDQKGPQN